MCIKVQEALVQSTFEFRVFSGDLPDTTQQVFPGICCGFCQFQVCLLKPWFAPSLTLFGICMVVCAGITTCCGFAL